MCVTRLRLVEVRARTPVRSWLDPCHTTACFEPASARSIALVLRASRPPCAPLAHGAVHGTLSVVAVINLDLIEALMPTALENRDYEALDIEECVLRGVAKAVCLLANFPRVRWEARSLPSNGTLMSRKPLVKMHPD